MPPCDSNNTFSEMSNFSGHFRIHIILLRGRLFNHFLSKQMEEFRAKIPKAPKKEPKGRDNFENITEFIDYILDKGEPKKS